MSRQKTTQQRKYSLLGLGIAEIEKDTGLQRKDFAGKLGFTAAYLTQLITGQKNNPTDRFFAAMAREFGVNKIWLQKRDGPKYRLGPAPDKKVEYPNLSTDAQYVSAHGRPYYGEDRRKEQRRRVGQGKDVEDRVLMIERHLHQLEEKFIELDKENKDLRAQCVKHERAPGHFEASKK